MKKFYLSMALMAPLAFCAQAAQLTPSQALGRISSGNGLARMERITDARPTLIVKAPGDRAFNALYVFANGESGYIIVSADDVAAPLLGYSDSGVFNANKVSPQLRYWLDFYASEIKYAAEHPNAAPYSAAQRPNRAAIAPLVKTQWNQSAPYNNDCPMYEGERSVTGCVATAMAQAMKYHNWPEKGKGSNSYTSNGQTISLDFSTITFDWNNMTDTYGAASTAEENAAVAKLMYACGVSVDMDYTSDESGASSMEIAPALYKYFDYSPAMTQPQRAFYGLIDWENMVYGQLEQGLPVLYGGQSNEGGHQFVCDGYSSDGYFHFNWGWAGESDGYYLLSALDPMTQGIGGSTTGFNYDQGIVINMQPANRATIAETPLIYCYGNFSTESSSAQLGQSVEFSSSDCFYNFGCKEESGAFGVKIVAADGSATYASASSVTLPVLEGMQSFTVALPSDLADGSYTVAPAFKSAGGWTDVLAPLSGVGALAMTVENGYASFSNDQTADVAVSGFTLASNIYLGTNFKATFDIENTGTTEYYGQLMMGLMDQGGNLVDETEAALAVDIDAGATESYTFIGEFPAEVETQNGGTEQVQPGNYTLVVFDMTTDAVVYEYPQQVEVRQTPAETSLEVSGLAITGGTAVADPSNIQFTGTVECTQGYYANQLKVAIFPEGATSTSIEGSTDYIFIDAGESDDFTATVSLDDAAAGSTYFAVVYDASNKQLSSALEFTISNETGVDDSVAADTTAPVRYYNLQGVEMTSDTLTPGIYLMRQGDAVSKVMIR